MSKRRFRINVDPQSLVPNDSVRSYYLISLVMTLGIAGLILLFYRSLPLSIPLLFTEPWGMARLTPKPYLYLLPLVSLLVLVTNVVIGKMMKIEDNRVLLHSLGIGALAVSTTLLVSLLGIIQSIL